MKLIKILSIFSIILICSTAHPQNFAPVDSVVLNAIADSVFPGAAIAVGNKDNTIFQKAYGNFTYEKYSPEVELNSMYDLASVTKAFCTNFCVMKLVDNGILDIGKKVSEYLPEFGQSGKENVRVNDLLIHESGLQAYYTPREEESRSDIIRHILQLPLSYETGSKTVYSCLNFVTTMMVVESVTNEPMYEYYKKNFTDPLEMNSTMFVPSGDYRSRCVPTSDDEPGIVHDPLAKGLDGLSGNAGLFSTIEDLSKLCMLLLNKGEYNGETYLSHETVEYFTKRYSDNTERAIGFDTRSEEGSSSGKYFSTGSYGHLGYTGTSIWIDPVKEIFVVFLTNRVYPDDTANISHTRPALHDAVMRSLGLAGTK
ncbi:MAG: serine hydrolase [Melioribacteraceae bacterium]|nr:serine hydrolase [Melioribacteraceae bacterium]